MSCRCATSDNVIEQGNNVPIILSLPSGSPLPEGWDIVVGFYDSHKKLLLAGDVLGGRITYNGESYRMEVGHDESMGMKGGIYVELTVTKDDGEKVYHGDKVIKLVFVPRLNNQLVPGGEEPMPFPGDNVITEEDIDNIMEA